MKPDASQLSRRERQILDVLYSERRATVARVRSQIPDPPTDMAVRRLIHILEEKGYVKRLSKVGREVVYAPIESGARAGLQAFQHVLKTFFRGSIDEALAAHFTQKETELTHEQVVRIQSLIEQARKEEKK
jgi:predicted transcriptional regulator